MPRGLRYASLADIPESVRPKGGPTKSIRVRLAGGRPAMNKTEQRYSHLLDLRVSAREIDGYRFGEIKLRLTSGCWYTPDFAVWMGGRLAEMHETKGGHIWEKNLVKWKWAAEQYPCFRFILTQWRDGMWRILHESGGSE